MRFSPGCQCCALPQDPLCPGCVTGSRPYQIEVTIADLVNDNCGVCSDASNFILTDLASLPSSFCYWFDPDLPGCKWTNDDTQWRRGNYLGVSLNLYTATRKVELEIQMYDQEHTNWDGSFYAPTVWIYKWSTVLDSIPIDCEVDFEGLELPFASMEEYNGGSGSTQPCDATGTVAVLDVV